MGANSLKSYVFSLTHSLLTHSISNLLTPRINGGYWQLYQKREIIYPGVMPIFNSCIEHIFLNIYITKNCVIQLKGNCVKFDCDTIFRHNCDTKVSLAWLTSREARDMNSCVWWVKFAILMIVGSVLSTWFDLILLRATDHPDVL